MKLRYTHFYIVIFINLTTCGHAINLRHNAPQHDIELDDLYVMLWDD